MLTGEGVNVLLIYVSPCTLTNPVYASTRVILTPITNLFPFWDVNTLFFGEERIEKNTYDVALSVSC